MSIQKPVDFRSLTVYPQLLDFDGCVVTSQRHLRFHKFTDGTSVDQVWTIERKKERERVSEKNKIN